MSSLKYIRKTSVLGVAYCGGAPDARCQLGPAAVQLLADQQGLSDCEHLHWKRPLALSGDGHSAERQLFHQLAMEVVDTITSGQFVAVYGGDHSCAIGTWSGVANAMAGQGPIGLIWVDAHMDSHTPETSPSGALHGMPLACLLGEGESAFIDIGGKGPKVHPQHLCLVGVRSYEAGEAELLGRMGVKVFSMNDVKRLGLAQVMAQAKAIASNGTAAYGLSVDLDGLDPQDAPGVGSPAVGGISANELLSSLAMFRSDSRFVALEVAELNPVMDIGGQTTQLAMDILTTITGQREVSHESHH